MKRILLSIAISVALMLPGAAASGCSCMPHELRTDVITAETVYFATLTAARAVEPAGDDILGHYEVTFKITECLKGELIIGESRNVTFLRCAIPLMIGDTYAVFEREERRTTRCWGTIRFDRSDWKADEQRKEEIRALPRQAAE